MKTPLSWLRAYTDLPETPQEIAEKLASLGFPVAETETRPRISGVLVGRIDALQPHPNADRLQICTIDVGNELLLTIATAATNVAVGQVIPVATIGAVLPNLTIEPRKMRGVDSQGMLCSASELGLVGEWFEDGIMQLDRDLPLGTDVVAHFGLLDPIFDIEVTSNRPDVLSIVGVARELAAAYQRPLRLPPITPPAPTGADEIQIKLHSDDVLAFVAQRVTGLTNGPAPSSMRIRLALAGQRPISTLVDISNYVMLEFGQPLHFYDARAINNATLIVRDAQSNEQLTTLDGLAQTLSPELLVVADQNGPLALAGIRGGATSEVQADTTEVIIECAAFRAARIRRGANRLGVRTEASSRFEKGIPPAMIELAAARAAYLLSEHGGQLHPRAVIGHIPKPNSVHLPRGAADRLLGFAISDCALESALSRLGFTLVADHDGWLVTAPDWRSDISQPADLIEEIARSIGYDQIIASEFALPPSPISSAAYLRERALATRSAALGFHEVVSFSLESGRIAERFAAATATAAPNTIAINNPLSEEQHYLRFSLLPGLLATLRRRQSELREGELSLFELSHIFPNNDPKSEQTAAMWISAYATTNQPNSRPWHDQHFLTFKGRIEALLRAFFPDRLHIEPTQVTGLHPGKTAAILHEGHIIAQIGALDPRLAAEYELDAHCYVAQLDLASLQERPPQRYRTPSRFPRITRDLALSLPKTVAAAQVQYIVAQAEPLVQTVSVFDEYHGNQLGPERKSLTVRVVLQSPDATLTDLQADSAIAHILSAAQSELGAVLRT